MLLTVYVKPRARETRIVEWIDADTVKIDIHAEPVKGKANQELIRFLADYYGIAASEIELVRGGGTKIKQLHVPNR